MTDSKYDELLKAFLIANQEERVHGVTLKNLHDKVDELRISQGHIANDHIELYQTSKRYGRRIGALEHEVALLNAANKDIPDWRADPSEITGTHQYKVIQKQQAEFAIKLAKEEQERRDSGIWWKRQRWIWVGAVITAVLIATIAGCSTYVISHLK